MKQLSSWLKFALAAAWFLTFWAAIPFAKRFYWNGCRRVF